jgi:hypothetical protein
MHKTCNCGLLVDFFCTASDRGTQHSSSVVPAHTYASPHRIGSSSSMVSHVGWSPSRLVSAACCCIVSAICVSQCSNRQHLQVWEDCRLQSFAPSASGLCLSRGSSCIMRVVLTQALRDFKCHKFLKVFVSRSAMPLLSSTWTASWSFHLKPWCSVTDTSCAPRAENIGCHAVQTRWSTFLVKRHQLNDPTAAT